MQFSKWKAYLAVRPYKFYNSKHRFYCRITFSFLFWSRRQKFTKIHYLCKPTITRENSKKKTKRKLSAKQVCTKTKSNGFSTFMQLKHWASEFAIPTKPTAFELRLGHKSRCLRLDWRDRLGEGVTIWVFAGYVQGEEIGGGGIGRIALWGGEGDFVAENGVLVGVWWIIGGDNKWTDSVVEDGFGNLRLFLLLFHW